jgi:solute:Na+ symporter, SSS family
MSVLGNLSWLDLVVFGGFLMAVFGLGLSFAKRAGADLSAFFLSGRSLPWYVAGSSMVATAFASDTPLWVTNLVRLHGIHYIWQFWAPMIGSALAMVYFGRKLRRFRFLTDIEFLECRYGGRTARALRSWSGLFGACVMCPLISAWVIKAMDTISREALGLPEEYRVVTTFAIVGLTVIMCSASGLFGVVMTDFLQLLISIGGSLLLAFLAVRAVGGLDVLVAQLSALESWGGRELSVLPSIGPGKHQMSVWNFIGYFGILWLLVGTSGGHMAQRLLASKNSLHASGAQMMHTLVYYGLMAWPWVIVALCSLVLMPDLGTSNQAAAYPRMLVQLTPGGVRGLLLAGMVAAFISTLSTLYNWGSSYLVNDLYRRHVNPQAGDHTSVIIARVATVVLAVAGSIISLLADNIQQILSVAFVVGAGGAGVAVLRWLWWRLNGRGDIASLIVNWIAASALLFLRAFDAPARWLLNLDPDISFATDPHLLGARMLLMFGLVISTAVIVSLLNPPEPMALLQRFIWRARPFAFGWRPVIKELDRSYEEIETWPRTLASWGVALGCGLCLLSGIGQLLLGSTSWGAALLVVFALLLYVTVRRLRQDYAREQWLEEIETKRTGTSVVATP